ncbi:Aldo/keto reductase [Pelagirhabdus alkalitolerans]|uniref:Aldo/keto reductase n=1 Tax=Pelagirhabdus alkalitolerans TaxID=1612202 RepID=A0A1G6GG39_9BACI|nr:aldo/keto reductase [Pelagirhabdus alkalitolerans]SDB80934.1 Aldo/keto reductase [Pelagirhabdus alkalitolerans]
MIPTITLNDGLEVLATGFGTYKLKGQAGVHALQSAIKSGYRLLDSAYNYENEGTLGRAIRETAVPREELVVTSKLPGRYHHYQDAVEAIQESLFRSQLDYFDLYLIHWPNPIQGHYVEAWQALLDAKKWGLIRSVGVCNFLPEHLEVLEKETGVLPSMNQIELHPYFNQEEQRAYHQEKGIQTQSWSPLARSQELLDQDVIQSIATRHQKSSAQIILRWHYQLGSISIPKSQNPQRQKQNLDIFDFELTADDIDRINQMTEPDGRRKNQNPAEYEEF